MIRWKLRSVLAIVAAASCVVMVASFLSMESAHSKSVKVPVAARDAMCGGGVREIIRVLPRAIEWNGVPVTTRELETQLADRMRNRADRVAFVEGSTGTPFGEVAHVIALLRALNIQAVMLTPSVKANDCSATAAVVPRRAKPAPEVEAVPWWKFW